MIIDFSTLGTGQGKDVDLCGQCKYFITVRFRADVPKVAWLTGDEIRKQYKDKDVKIVIRALTRCKGHSSPKGAKPQPEFMNAALRSGIDVKDVVDRYRRDVLGQRHPEPFRG